MNTEEVEGRIAVTTVVVTGSECTGKSTLARDLADAFGVECVPEYVRTFVEVIGGRPQFSDHGPIARGQRALEDQYRARASGLLVHDTDLLSTVAYCRAYFGRCPEWIEAAAVDRTAGLYLVCDIDVPWVADGLRDRGEARTEMHQLFVSVLEEARANYVVISGSRAARLAAARRHVETLAH